MTDSPTPAPAAAPDQQAKTRVVIADDHQLMREGLKYTLARAAQPGYKVIAEADSSTAAVRIVSRLRPELLIMDITMPGGCGLDAIGDCLRGQEQLAVVVLTMHDQPSFVREAIRRGARGYVLKDASPAELVGALRLVLHGGSYLAPGLMSALASPPSAPSPAEALGTREREVVRLLALGHTYPEIARRMNFSERTVKNYRAKASQALGITTRAQFTAWALQNSLIGSSPAAA